MLARHKYSLALCLVLLVVCVLSMRFYRLPERKIMSVLPASQSSTASSFSASILTSKIDTTKLKNFEQFLGESVFNKTQVQEKPREKFLNFGSKLDALVSENESHWLDLWEEILVLLNHSFPSVDKGLFNSVMRCYPLYRQFLAVEPNSEALMQNYNRLFEVRTRYFGAELALLLFNAEHLMRSQRLDDEPPVAQGRSLCSINGI